jgi:prevent-host-death family protein
MLDITKDIQSLTTLRRSSGEFLKQLKKSKLPVVLTVNGKAEAVVQDAAAYQRLWISPRKPTYTRRFDRDSTMLHSAGRARLAKYWLACVAKRDS